MALVKKKCRIMPGSFNTHWLIETTRYMLLNVGQTLGFYCGDYCLVLSGSIDFFRDGEEFY
jgi:hypothetical protein